MLPPRPVRRAVLAPLVLVIAVGFIVLSPFLALAALVSGLLARSRAGHMRSLRLVCFALVWFVAETVALVMLAPKTTRRRSSGATTGGNASTPGSRRTGPAARRLRRPNPRNRSQNYHGCRAPGGLSGLLRLPVSPWTWPRPGIRG